MWKSGSRSLALDCRTVRQRRFTSSFRQARPARKLPALSCTLTLLPKHRFPAAASLAQPQIASPVGRRVVPDHIQPTAAPLSQLSQEGCRRFAVAVSIQFHPLHLSRLQAHRRIVAGFLATPRTGGLPLPSPPGGSSPVQCGAAPRLRRPSSSTPRPVPRLTLVGIRAVPPALAWSCSHWLCRPGHDLRSLRAWHPRNTHVWRPW